MDNRCGIGGACLLAIIIGLHAQSEQPLVSVPFFRIFDQQTELVKNDYVVNQETRATPITREKTDWLVQIYMAADNNLNYFAWHNIKQMAAAGSNKNVTIIVQLNEPGANKKTQRYLIEQNKAVLLNQDQISAGKKFNTGDPQTLIDFSTETMTQFPANHVALVFWDHGTGYLDPFKTKLINIHELFQLNPSDMMLELTRNDNGLISQLDRCGQLRGICFDETYHSYLSNQKVNYALQTICQKTGRKFDIIGLDACMMQMLEFGCLLSPYANYMVGSQEVELGAGWNYKYIFTPFGEKSFAPDELACHIVSCYQKTYSRITHDYTLSAVNLNKLLNLANTISATGTILQQCLKSQQDKSVKNTLANCRAKKNCTCFDEPSYLDIGHLYKNILSNINQFKLSTKPELVSQLQKIVEQGEQQLQAAVIANVSGKNLSNARGLSIYFPERTMHASYPRAPFATHNSWASFLQDYLSQ